MKLRTIRILGFVIAMGSIVTAGAQSPETVGNTNAAARTTPNTGPVTMGVPRIFGSSANLGGGANLRNQVRTEAISRPATSVPELTISTQSFPGSEALLPLWTFDILGSRDGDHHRGTIVGHSPFNNPQIDRIPTHIIPLLIRTHRVATAIDPKTLNLTTAPGDTITDPTAPDNACLTAPNNVPATLVRQSPIMTPTKFVFGGTNMGTTQYLDAFERASFFKALGSRLDQYHVLLNPIRMHDPVVIDVPANEGLSINDPNFFQAFKFSICAPLQFVDINWFDSYVQGTLLPALAAEGIDADSLPVFISYEAAWPVGDVTNIGNCCAIGYHNAAGAPIVTQTYAVADFDRTQFFSGPPAGLDTDPLSHEIGEWINDPFGSNLTAPWGHTGQVAGCQANLEVGDPLSGTDLAPVTMPNGFTYHLQELAFFSWFYGAPSVGVHGWFSNNNSFSDAAGTPLDAGPPCP
jgi:hypothetical protein